MNTKEFKKKLIRSICQPELFLLPAPSAEQWGAPLIYKVKQQEVYLQISNEYRFFYIPENQEDMIIDGENIGKRKMGYAVRSDTFKGYIDWGDGILTDFLQEDNSKIYRLKIEHTYTDGLLFHNISIYGRIPSISLYGFPIEIIQWGNIHLKQLYNFINPDDNCSDCTDEFKIPDAPLTGMDELSYIFQLFTKCAINKIPDNFFCNCRSLIYAYYCFQECNQLIELGNNLFKDLTSLAFIYSIAHNCKKLEIIGDSLFENCINLDGYTCPQIGSDHRYWTNNTCPIYGCPIFKIGNNMFKNCISLQIRKSGKPIIESFEREDTFQSHNMSGMQFAYDLFNVDVWNSNRPPRKIVQIGESTFEGCTHLKCLDYMFWHSPPIKKLSKTTFKGCKNVLSTYYTFGEPSGQINLEEGIFDDMIKLKYIPRMYSKGFVNILPKIPCKFKNLYHTLYCINNDYDASNNYPYVPVSYNPEQNNYGIIRYFMQKQEYYLQDGTKLPELEWNELYTNCSFSSSPEDRYEKTRKRICHYSDINGSNWTEYIQKVKMNTLDITKMFAEGIENNCIATLAFHGGHHLLNCYDWYDNKETNKKEIREYGYTCLTGICPPIWDYGLHKNFSVSLDSSVYENIGLDNFNTIPQDDRHIIGYSNIYEGAPDYIKNMNNEELTRYLGNVRVLSEGGYKVDFDEIYSKS